jgi:hypothetical protein
MLFFAILRLVFPVPTLSLGGSSMLMSMSGHAENLYYDWRFCIVAEKVFLLGRPGSGKTTALHYIQNYVCGTKPIPVHPNYKHPKFTHQREYTTLQEMMRSDSKNKFLPAKYGGFEVRDDSVFEESARRFEERLRNYLTTKASEEEFIFIELARKEYKESMRCFSPDFLQDSYFLFIEADVATCIERIHSRVAQSAPTGNHFIPDHVLRDYYSQDNLAYMASDFKTNFNIQKEVRAIDNRGSIDQFYANVKDFANTLLAAATKYWLYQQSA